MYTLFAYFFFFKIWDLSDPTATGFLTKPGVFVALKLISLAQAGRDISMLNITQQSPPPNMVLVILHYLALFKTYTLSRVFLIYYFS